MHISTRLEDIERAYQETRPRDWSHWHELNNNEREAYRRFVHELERLNHPPPVATAPGETVTHAEARDEVKHLCQREFLYRYIDQAEKTERVLEEAMGAKDKLYDGLTELQALLREREGLLLELETFLRQRPAQWQQTYRVRLDPLLAKLDALRASQQPATTDSSPSPGPPESVPSMSTATPGDGAGPSPAAAPPCTCGSGIGQQPDSRHGTSCPWYQVEEYVEPNPPAAAHDPRPLCIVCKKPWVPCEGEDATVTTCLGCVGEDGYPPAAAIRDEAWVPKPGNVARWEYSATHQPIVTVITTSASSTAADVRDSDGKLWLADVRDLRRVEPSPVAPQPAPPPAPDVAGRDRPVMLGELCAALRQLAGSQHEAMVQVTRGYFSSLAQGLDSKGGK
jgi:hypothetical protein